QTLRGVIGRIRNFKILRFAWREAAQILREGREGVFGAEFEHEFVGLDRLTFHPGGSGQRNHGKIAVRRRARIYVDMLRLLLTDFLDALVYVFVGDGRFLVGNFHLFILAELDLRDHFKHRFEAQRLALLEMHFRDVGRSHHVQVLRFELLLKMLGDEAFQNLLPDNAGKLLPNQRRGSLARPDAAQLPPILHVGGNVVALALHNFDQHGDFKRVLATYEYSQV